MFWCNLKNYDSEIDKFAPVLDAISEYIIYYAERYEEDDEYVSF